MADMKDHMYFTNFENVINLTPYIFYRGNPFAKYMNNTRGYII